MRKVFLLMILVSSFISCRKSDTPTDPQQAAFQTFIGKYLVSDSVKITVNGSTNTMVLGKGKGWDLYFGAYGNLEVYTSPVVYKSFLFGSPNKIYFWTDNYSTDHFYTIDSMNGNKIVLTNADQASGKVYTQYLTAE
jgi:hypothetical protein